MKATQLNATQITEAKSLLYQYYFDCLGWEIETDNPSGMRLAQANGDNIIVDDYDPISTWFGVIHQQKIISSARLCAPDANGMLELERYDEAQNKLKFIFDKKDQLNLLELNRESILPDAYSNKKPCFLLLSSIFKYCLLHKHSVITTTNIEKWVNLYNQIFDSKLEDRKFKYFHTDPEPVEVYFAQFHEIEKILRNIDSILLRSNQDEEFLYG